MHVLHCKNNDILQNQHGLLCNCEQSTHGIDYSESSETNHSNFVGHYNVFLKLYVALDIKHVFMEYEALQVRNVLNLRKKQNCFHSKIIFAHINSKTLTFLWSGLFMLITNIYQKVYYVCLWISNIVLYIYCNK